MTEGKAIGCGIAALVMWCLTPAMLALTGGMPPFLVGASSFLTAFAAACAWWMWKGEDILSKFKMPLASYALGILGFGLYNILYVYSFKHGPSLEVNLLNYVWPATLIVAGSLMQRRVPDVFALTGIALCLIGVFFVFSSRGALDFSGSHAMLAIGVLCGVLWGSYSALSKAVAGSVDRIPVFFLIAGAPMLVLHMLYEPVAAPATALNWIMLGLYTACRLAFFLWDYAMKHGQARVIGSLSYFIPFFATMFLVLAGYGRFDMTLILGGGLIIAGCLVINLDSLLPRAKVAV